MPVATPLPIITPPKPAVGALQLQRQLSANTLSHVPKAHWCLLKDRVSLVSEMRVLANWKQEVHKAPEQPAEARAVPKIASEGQIYEAKQTTCRVKFGVRSKSCFDFACRDVGAMHDTKSV